MQGALISMDPQTGYVHAMIGGYNFEQSEFNRAFQACRQPGSTFKAIVYAAAVDLEDFTPSTTLVDSPIIMDDTDAKKRWKPQNFEEEFLGDVTVRTAVMNSDSRDGCMARLRSSPVPTIDSAKFCSHLADIAISGR